MIWWMNRYSRCQSDAERECVNAWFEASLAYNVAKWHLALRAIRALSP